MRRSAVVAVFTTLLIGSIALPAQAFNWGAKTNTPGTVHFYLGDYSYGTDNGPVVKMGQDSGQMVRLHISIAPSTDPNWTSYQHVQVNITEWYWSSARQRYLVVPGGGSTWYDRNGSSTWTTSPNLGLGRPEDVPSINQYEVITYTGYVQWWNSDATALIAQEYFWPTAGNAGYFDNNCSRGCPPNDYQMYGSRDFACVTYALDRGTCGVFGLWGSVNLHSPTGYVYVLWA